MELSRSASNGTQQMTLFFEQLERREVLSAFTLHSNPGADHTIYLDFDGHVTEGTAWNNVPCQCLDQIITPPYSIDADPDFSETELANIETMWARSAEDFWPFDVNVTTQEPGTDRLSNSGGGDTTWGQRIVIGGSSSDWSGSSAGGLSFLGSFDWDSDTPAFVFENNFSGGLGIKGIAEAATHETGHTLGLGHDGTSVASLYVGHGNGETGWVPIMGNSALRQLTQWSQGEYPDANNQQDDLAVITTTNGFGYRVDSEGIIGQRDDVDVFEVVSTGVISLQIDPASVGPNLDILANLYNAQGVLISSSNPVDTLDATINWSGSGTFYLEIDGTGKPANGSDYGYSDYGSLGQYFISGTPTPVFIPPENPQIAWAIADFAAAEGGNNAVTPFTFTVTRTGDADYAATLEWTMVLDGTANAGDFVSVASGSVEFAAGQMTATITIFVAGDKKKEANETFHVVLTNASLGSFADDTALGTIINDDGGGQ